MPGPFCCSCSSGNSGSLWLASRHSTVQPGLNFLLGPSNAAIPASAADLESFRELALALQAPEGGARQSALKFRLPAGATNYETY